MEKRRTAIVIGSGAGGAMAARELQKRFDVTILEAGGEFKPFRQNMKLFSALRKSGLFFDEKLITRLMPNMLIRKTEDMVMVYGRGVGGTTTLATGNALRYDMDLKRIGIELDIEFEELSRELPITTEHSRDWHESTKRLFNLFEEMGLDPVITPKFLNPKACAHCGHCAIGCPTKAKWDARVLVDEAVSLGAVLVSNCRVDKLVVDGKKVISVEAKIGGSRKSFTGDIIVLAAGGFNTPVILKNSGIETEKRLFVDPVLCVAAPILGFGQDKELLMPFISQQEGYILSPYMDYLSFFFNRKWYRPMENIASIMIKLKDETAGDVSAGRIEKTLTKKDREILDNAVELSKKILLRLGANPEEIFLGTLNAGHPGGMLSLTENEKESLHNERLPENLYISDSTLFNDAMGNPPILTIMALAKKIAKVIS